MDVEWINRIGLVTFLLSVIYGIRRGLRPRAHPLDAEAKEKVTSRSRSRSEPETPAPEGKAWVRIGGREILVDQEALAAKPPPPNFRSAKRRPKKKAKTS